MAAVFLGGHIAAALNTRGRVLQLERYAEPTLPYPHGTRTQVLGQLERRRGVAGVVEQRHES